MYEYFSLQMGLLYGCVVEDVILDFIW